MVLDLCLRRPVCSDGAKWDGEGEQEMRGEVWRDDSRDDFSNVRGGFTLIELLVVVVVLGILAAIVILAVSGTTQNAQVAACKSEAATVHTAVEAYYAQNGIYPTYSDLDGTFLREHPVDTMLIMMYGGGGSTPPEIDWCDDCNPAEYPELPPNP